MTVQQGRIDTHHHIIPPAFIEEMTKQGLDKVAAVKLARRCNEFAADMRNRFPGQFGNFAVLPTPFADLAAREAEYALDTLGADSVVLLGSQPHSHPAHQMDTCPFRGFPALCGLAAHITGQWPAGVRRERTPGRARIYSALLLRHRSGTLGLFPGFTSEFCQPGHAYR
jgi:hypothetical protein